MALADRWLLPEGVKDILPPEASQIEAMRRRLLDLFDSWGYDLVMPPLMEHLDALLTGVGGELDLNTFKLTDQLSGHTLGIRADITPQVARIDAHRMRNEGASRLCYCSSVLHARSTQPLASRNPLQIGAELFGHAGLDSDVEVIALMIETLQTAGADSELSLDLGHVGIFRGLMEDAGLSSAEQAEYQSMLQRKALPELERFLNALDVDARLLDRLAELPRLHGGIEVLARAKALFADAPQMVLDGIDYLEQLAARVAKRFPDLDLYFDLSELRGYNYHTGIVFAAYTPAYGQALAKGGRYDDIGQDFGRARPATGFSADLKTLVDLAASQRDKASVVVAPAGEDVALLYKINELRAQGVRVIQTLSGDDQPANSSAELVLENGEWTVKGL
ncbi:ATP phosphoribosyltransferase regulatory subunit [Pontibacterium granulatum]|uniref:ATP phosphoribosyltransferase regulatory subunit n=1 Tax=Pontibacterium granulatum TaxID=2036029 RepID=UPI00249C756A|nr:ATP phosphoribosyltransferase regulatory subunit [Pontibacterium granulatum]MDI3323687.1 ATP phosphoribosyltransferase regulatory subunit [Pontibacterium granulatum]